MLRKYLNKKTTHALNFEPKLSNHLKFRIYFRKFITQITFRSKTFN